MFICKRCRYTYATKSLLKRHLSHKVQCEPIGEDIDNKILINELYPKKTYECEKCNKSYVFATNLSRHKTNFHSIIGNKTQNKSSNNLSNSSGKKTINNITNSTVNQNCTTNNTININIRNYGDEDVSYITDQILTELVRKGFLGGVLDYTERVYLNEDHKENNTVVVKYETSPNARIMLDGVYQLRLANEVITEIITKGGRVIKNHHDKNQDLFKNDPTLKHFNFETDLYRKREEPYYRTINRKTKNKFVNDQIKIRNKQKKGKIKAPV